MAKLLQWLWGFMSMPAVVEMIGKGSDKIFKLMGAVLTRFGISVTTAPINGGAAALTTWAKAHPVQAAAYSIGIATLNGWGLWSLFSSGAEQQRHPEGGSLDQVLDYVSSSIKKMVEYEQQNQMALTSLNEEIDSVKGKFQVVDLVNQDSYADMAKLKEILQWATRQYGSAQNVLEHHSKEVEFLALQRDDVVRGLQLFSR